MSGFGHILVVDDHREIRDLVGQLLVKNGYRVTAAADGAAMHQALKEHKIDLIVLDIMLPVEDGLDLCRGLRAEGCRLPIIMLTAKGDELDRVLGLEMGADDYVPKPFSGRELLARIKAVLRRVNALPPNYEPPAARRFRFLSWALDTARRELESEDGVVVPLSSGEYSLLLTFVMHPQRVLSRDQLLDLAKGRSGTMFDRAIDTQVSRLRRKLGDDAKNPALIKTVWGGGYMFTPTIHAE